MVLEERYYHNYMDALSKLGGHKTSIMTIVSALSPVFLIIYLVKLVLILKQSFHNEYYNELTHIIQSNMDNLKVNEEFLEYS